MKIVDNDNWLSPVADEVQKRYDRFCNCLKTIEKQCSVIVRNRNGHPLNNGFPIFDT